MRFATSSLLASRPSSEGAADYLDRAAALCRQAGFRTITFRGDTDEAWRRAETFIADEITTLPPWHREDERDLRPGAASR